MIPFHEIFRYLLTDYATVLNWLHFLTEFTRLRIAREFRHDLSFIDQLKDKNSGIRLHWIYLLTSLMGYQFRENISFSDAKTWQNQHQIRLDSNLKNTQN